jgi:RNA polymerase sigma-70 factor (ECF subfamily)
LDTDRLVSLCQAGDEGALAELYRLHAPAAFKTAYLITGDRAMAEDVVQETFIQVIRKIHTLQQAASLRSWIYKVLTRQARDAARSAVWSRWLPFDRRPEAESADENAARPLDRLEAQEELLALRAAIRQLKSDHRLAVVLFYYTGLSEQEIAQVAGIPVGTVKSRLFYARRELHQMLSSEQSGPVAVVSLSERNGEQRG